MGYLLTWIIIYINYYKMGKCFGGGVLAVLGVWVGGGLFLGGGGVGVMGWVRLIFSI